jgi:iron complex outermembrane receptor protein
MVFLGIPMRLAARCMLYLAVSAGLSATASAQPAGAGEAVELDRITVTAGKREQSAREVAGSVQAITGAQLEAALGRDQEDLVKLAPGIQLNKNDPDRAMPTIRAVGTVLTASSLGQQQGTTGLYVGDVPVTDPFGYTMLPDIAPLDLDRVELLRGPQGALFGSGALGGAIRYVLADASTAGNSFSGLAGFDTVSGGGSGHRLGGSANLASASGRAAVRVSFHDRADGGYIDNIGTGRRDANTLDQRGGRLAITLQPTAALRLSANVMSQETDIADGFAVGADPDRLEIDTPTASPRTSRFDLANLRVGYEFGPMELVWTSALARKDLRASTDVTEMTADVGQLIDPSLPAFEVALGSSMAETESRFNELRLIRTGERSNLVFGASHQTSEIFNDGGWRVPGGADSWGELGFLLPDDMLTTETGRVHSREQAVFGTASIELPRGFTAEVGGRYYENTTRYHIEAMQFAQELELGNGISESGFTPRVSLSKRFGPHMAYALASRGYRLGGVNAASGTEYDSDSLWNYEAGLRLSPSPRTQLDLTGFLIDWDDAQVNARVVTPGELTVFGIANVGKIRIRGLEAALRMKAGQAWDLDASLAWTDAETARDYQSNNGSTIASGSPIPNAPRLQSTTSVAYAFDGPLASHGSFQLSHQFTASRHLALELPGEAPSYHSVDARLWFARDAWQLGLHAHNLFDSRAIAGGGAQADLGGGLYHRYYLIRPRTFGVTLRYDY